MTKANKTKVVERKLLSMYITGLIVGIMAVGATALALKLGNQLIIMVALAGAGLIIIVPPLLLKIFEGAFTAEPQISESLLRSGEQK